MTIVIENTDYVLAAGGVVRNKDLVIEDGILTGIREPSPGPGPVDPRQKRIDGSGKAALAGFKNAHTHAAMTLLRGYGDDMRLQPWLQERIWPAEAQLTEEDIYWGTRLAALEMISGGTVFANDMYFQAPQVRRAFRDAGLRAAVGYALFDFGDGTRREAVQEEVTELLRDGDAAVPRGSSPQAVFPVIAPHSVYTCSGDLLRWAAETAAHHGLVLHIHMNETEQEVRDCLDAHGVRPFQWLEQLGVLEAAGSRMIAAHAIWLDAAELDLVARYGVTVAHNPASNMKLASGCFPWSEYARRDVPVMLAPDGVASNNNLDMFDEMKLAALLQKHHFGDPTRLPAEEIVQIATGARSTLFREFGVGGALQEGQPADLMLIDLDHPQMVPVHNLVSNLAYAANGSVVDTVLCDGTILMAERKVPGAREVLAESRRCAAALARRVQG